VGGVVLLRLSPKKGEGNLDDAYRITVAGRPIEAGAERARKAIDSGAAYGVLARLAELSGELAAS